MKVIFSPSKEMNFSGEPLTNKSIGIDSSNKTDEIYSKLITFSTEEISKKFKVKNEMLEEVLNDLMNFPLSQEKNAIEAYSGIAFRQLDMECYTKSHWDYIGKNLFILSAFYGITCGLSRIKKHRLDFSIKLFENESLYKFWSEYVNNFFSENEIVINLASNEYSKLLDKKRICLVNLNFYENRDFKQISANSKKARGEMLNLIIMNKIKKSEDIKTLKMKEYSYNPELSYDNNLIFIKN